jgi:hypothetical protein
MNRSLTISRLVSLALVGPAALVTPVVLAAPAEAADTVLAAAPDTAAITAYAGQVVLSQLDPLTGQWALVRYENGAFTRLPITERAVPFDADAGPDAGGNPVVVYSRCAQEPAATGFDATPDWETATGCDLYELPLTGAPTEQKLTAASAPGESETTPSIWKGNLAFVRHADGSAVPTIEYLRRGATKPSHLAGGSVQLCEQAATEPIDCSFATVHDTVDQLDLGPTRIAYLWSMTGGSVYGVDDAWELRAATLNGGQSTLLDTGEGNGTCGFDLPNAPTVSASSIFYVSAGAICDVTVTDFETIDPVTGIHALAPTPGGLAAGAVEDGNTIYWLRVAGAPADVPLPGDGSCSVADADCDLVASTPPPYVAQAPTQVSPPADIDFTKSGLGYKWVTGPAGVRLLRPPAEIPCAPSALPAILYLSAEWTNGRHTVRVIRQDPGRASQSLVVIARSLPDFEVAAEPHLRSCLSSTRLTYAVKTGGVTQTVSFTVRRMPGPPK